MFDPNSLPLTLEKDLMASRARAVELMAQTAGKCYTRSFKILLTPKMLFSLSCILYVTYNVTN